MAGRLGELLVRENLISLQQLQKAQEEQKKAGGRIGYHLTKLGFIEESELTTFLSKQYGIPTINLSEFAVDLRKTATDAPVVKLVNMVLIDAFKQGASDIHVEPYERDFRVRYRVDGVLYEVMKPPLKLKAAITSRLKIMAEQDIAERRLPQDGRIKLKLGKGREMDFRVSVCPTLFGEKVVLRLLDKSNLQLDMTKLGFDPDPLKAFKEAIDRPYGMVLVTGPTGSGKTTSPYPALSELSKTSDNISTAEDPVQFNFAGINQVQMHEDISLNFAAP